MEGQGFKTEVAAVSTVQWLSQTSVMTITDTGFLTLYPSENSFQKFLAWILGGRVGYNEGGQKAGDVGPIFSCFFPFAVYPHITTQRTGAPGSTLES